MTAVAGTLYPARTRTLALAIPHNAPSLTAGAFAMSRAAPHHREEVGSMWAKITVHHAEGGKTELTCGDDGAAYPDESREVVARVLDLYRATLGVE